MGKKAEGWEAPQGEAPSQRASRPQRLCYAFQKSSGRSHPALRLPRSPRFYTHDAGDVRGQTGEYEPEHLRNNLSVTLALARCQASLGNEPCKSPYHCILKVVFASRMVTDEKVAQKGFCVLRSSVTDMVSTELPLICSKPAGV